MKIQPRNMSHFRWIPRKKQYGFTLVEMMVVMAIIAILATMGVSGFTGHMKKVRDTDRKLDIAYLDSVVSDFRREHGKFPPSEADFNAAVSAATNGQMVRDPLNTEVSCVISATDTSPNYCGYMYNVCDDGKGYLLSAKFETENEAQHYAPIPGHPKPEGYYNVGHCTAIDIPAPASVPDGGGCTDKDSCLPNRVCVGPPNKTCRPKNEQSIGAECDVNEDCMSGNCNTHARKCKASNE